MLEFITSMADIILTTLNAKYIHSSFGLRYLFANLNELQSRALLLEFEISHRPHEVVENLLSHNPSIIGLGVYIWNTRQIKDLLEILRAVAPEVTVILGGPEISYDTESHELFSLCDHVIQGEADLSFAEICRGILSGTPPLQKIVPSPLPSPAAIRFPYSLYSEDDIAHRIVYVEASRGCPFTCEFCLSSLEVPVRQFELNALLEEMETLLQRGVRQFKFVDRSFNLHLKTSRSILEFFLRKHTPGLFIHFEMVPDRLPDSLREIIAMFPAGALQFEVGIQSFNPDVGKLISRRQDFTKLADNIRFLRAHTGVHIHADLIAGLPGETLESFAQGFNTLVTLDPQEIQVGILKRLRGTPIIRHDREWKMVYSPNSPYEILSNSLIDFKTMQRLGRFSRYWDIVANSGNFTSTKPLLWTNSTGPFEGFMEWSDWLYAKSGTRFGFSLKNLAGYLYEYLTIQKLVNKESVSSALERDFSRLKRTDLPVVLKNQLNTKQLQRRAEGPIRQGRHAES